MDAASPRDRGMTSEKGCGLLSSSTLAPTRPGAEPEPQPEVAPPDAAGQERRATPRAPASRGEYRPDIDGIRGAAAIMVMGFHAKVPGFEGAYIGLDLFFVVSGYVITGLLMYEFTKTGSDQVGRVLRPPRAPADPGQGDDAHRRPGRSATSSSRPPRWAATAPQQQTAQLGGGRRGLRLQLLLPRRQPGRRRRLLHPPARHRRAAAHLVALGRGAVLPRPPDRDPARLAGSPSCSGCRWSAPCSSSRSWPRARLARGWRSRWPTTDPDAAYYLPITRAFEFLIGVALALVARKHAGRPRTSARSWAWPASPSSRFVLWKPMPVDGYPSYWALLPCAAAALLVWAGVGGPTVVTRFLSIKFLVGLGLVSYGWYLWHWPFLVLGESLNLAPPPLLRARRARAGRAVRGLAELPLHRGPLLQALRHRLEVPHLGLAPRDDQRRPGHVVRRRPQRRGPRPGRRQAKTSPHWESVTEQLGRRPADPRRVPRRATSSPTSPASATWCRSSPAARRSCCGATRTPGCTSRPSRPPPATRTSTSSRS